jgi:transposase, IS30 family
MNRLYRHLTEEDRIVIHTLLQEGKSKKYIADRIGCDISTIKREIRRNTGLRGYRPKQAQAMANERLKKPRVVKMTPEVVNYIEEKLREDYSPEQISGTMADIIDIRVYHERIYQHIWQDKRMGGDLYTHLRIAGGKKTRKRYGKKDWRGRIPGRIDIESRPAVIEEKTRIGDWEADLVSGSHHQGFLVTMVERASKFTLIGHVSRKTSEAVTAEITRLMYDVKDLVHTITYDNGREFSGHQEINQALGCESYFAKPYHSWERGLNENTNGLIRQYFPKKTDLRQITPDQIKFVQDRLNMRPRKTLDFNTPQKVFTEVS